MNKLETLKSQLKRGQVYRRADVSKWSTAVDRHLKALVEEGTLKKLSPGVYYYPKQTAFGEAPADEMTLVRTFLKDDRFLLTSPNLYNSLGVGTTQLYNSKLVYNHKRHGDFKLGNRMFSFRIKPHFPSRLSQEFLLVDLVNHLDQLAEEPQMVLDKVLQKAKTMNSAKMKKSLKDYGNEKTKRLLLPALEASEQNV
jgi:hypothetical protein